MVDLLSLMAVAGKNAKSVMPWTLRNDKTARVTDEEVAIAQAELEAGVVFS